jgi:hypothetical protein
VRLLLFDVDGVLTDGVVVMHADGSESKGFHIRDGAAIVWAQGAGLTVGLLSARNSGATAQRAAQLDVRVERYVLPKYEIKVELPKEWVLASETIVGTVSAEYSFGKPVQGEVEIVAARYVGTWEEYARISQPLAVGRPHARDDTSGRGIDHITPRVHGDERRDDQAVRPDDRRAAEARFHRALVAGDLADGRTGAGADGAFRHGAGGCGARGLISAVRVGPNRRLPFHPQVDENRGRHDRHDDRPHLEANLPLFEIAHHAGRGVEPECASARERDRVDLLHGIHWIEERRLARPGRAAALRQAADGAFSVNEDHRAAGRPFGECVMADLQAGHLC